MRKLRRRKIPYVTPDEIQRVIGLIQGRRFEAVSSRSDTLAIEILRRFTSTGWLDRHVNTSSGFLRKDVATPSVETLRMRRIMLAEMLYNFQNTRGFHNCLTELNAGQVESAYASLEIARMLATHATDRAMRFRFVTPCGIKRRDYDLSIRCGDGVNIRAETKCKLEETDITIRTLEDSFSQAKRQLPKGAPGVIFLKVPRHWITDEAFVQQMRSLAARILLRSPWIVSIKYYTSRIVENVDQHGETLSEIIGFEEYTNSDHHFPRWRNRDWHLFPKNQPPAAIPTREFNGMPASWQRLIVSDTWR